MSNTFRTLALSTLMMSAVASTGTAIAMPVAVPDVVAGTDAPITAEPVYYRCGRYHCHHYYYRSYGYYRPYGYYHPYRYGYGVGLPGLRFGFY